MQLKKFEGTSMEEILSRVKKTLGEDALILSTQRKSSKGLGPFTKTVYEVSAAVDRTAEPALAGRRVGPPGYRPAAAPHAPHGEEVLFTPLSPPPAKSAAASRGENAPPADASPATAPTLPPFGAFLSLEKELAPLKEEIASLREFLAVVRDEQRKPHPEGRRNHLELLAREVRSLHDYLKAGPADRPAAGAGAGRAGVSPPSPKGEDWLVRRLLAQGVSPDVTRAIRDTTMKNLPPDRRGALDELRRMAGVVIASSVRAAGIPAPPPSAPRILAFVGPPGSGKTTVVARAGRFLAGKGFRVAVVTVGERAADLRLLIGGLQRPHGVPVLSAGTAEELSRAVATCFGANYILVDVAGCRSADRAAITALVEMFRRHADVDFCLTLPSEGNGAGAGDPVRSLSPLEVRYLAFTRMDEAQRFGGLVNTAVSADRPVLFLTAGPSPAGGIFPARPYMFSRLLLEKTGAPQERTHP